MKYPPKASDIQGRRDCILFLGNFSLLPRTACTHGPLLFNSAESPLHVLLIWMIVEEGLLQSLACI